MKNKVMNRQWTAPLASFLAVWGIYMFYFALRGFWPFGERSIAWCDMEQQYVPLMLEVRSIVLDGGSVLLGKGGGGMNFWGVFLFFVSSPFILLSLLISEENIIFFVNILTVLKLSLCGVTAELYFQRVFPKMPRSFGVLMSIMYSMSGCVMMYYQNNMWIEMMILFPLLLLSMFRLCEKGKWGSYVLCLSAAMYLNFYISFMYVIFIVIAGGLMLIFCCKGRLRPDRAVKFIIGDICAALMTAVVWIPAFKQFMASGRGSSSAKLFFSETFFENSYDKAALLACTSIVFAVAAEIFFERKRLKSGRGAFFALITAVMMFGAFIEPANKLWHTGSYQAFPFRYGFMIVLTAMSVCGVLLSERISYRTETEVRSRKIRLGALVLLLIFAASAVLVYIYSDKINSYVNTLWVEGRDALILVSFSALGALVYFVCIRKYCSGTLKKSFTLVAMTFVMLIESMLGFNVYFGNAEDVAERYAQTVVLNDDIDDESFYRVKSTKRYFYTNMLEGLGFSSIGHYTSLTDGDFLYASKRLGYSSYWMDNSANGGTIITDAFLMNKYFFGIASDMNGLTVPYNEDGLIKIYRNTLISDGAVISQTAPEELAEFDRIQRMDATEYIAERLYGADDITEKIEPYAYSNVTVTEDENSRYFTVTDTSQKASINYNIFVEGRKELYFDLFSNYSTSLSEPYFGAVTVYVNGKPVEKEYPNKRASGILDLGTFENKYVSVKIAVHGSFAADTFGLYALDIPKAEACVGNTGTASISLEGNRINITADSAEGGYVYIPFAYSEGYTAELNGEKADIHKVLGSFMSVKLEKGSNELVLTFYPTGFKTGIALTLLGTAVFVLVMLLKPKTKKLGRIANAAHKLLIAAAIVTAAVIYVIAPVLWLVFQFLI